MFTLKFTTGIRPTERNMSIARAAQIYYHKGAYAEKPEVKPVEQKKPEAKADQKPEVKPVEQKKPEVKLAEQKKPEVKPVEQKKPEVKPVEQKKPEAKAEQQKAEKLAEQKKPEKPVEQKKPEAKAEQQKPEAKAEQQKADQKPEVKPVEQKKPDTKAEQQKADQKPEVKPVEQKKPEAKAEQQKPEKPVEQKKPEVKPVEQKKPEAKAEQQKPVEPVVEVLDSEGNIVAMLPGVPEEAPKAAKTASGFDINNFVKPKQSKQQDAKNLGRVKNVDEVYSFIRNNAVLRPFDPMPGYSIGEKVAVLKTYANFNGTHPGLDELQVNTLLMTFNSPDLARKMVNCGLDPKQVLGVKKFNEVPVNKYDSNDVYDFAFEYTFAKKKKLVLLVNSIPTYDEKQGWMSGYNISVR